MIKRDQNARYLLLFKKFLQTDGYNYFPMNLGVDWAQSDGSPSSPHSQAVTGAGDILKVPFLTCPLLKGPGTSASSTCYLKHLQHLYVWARLPSFVIVI